MILGIDSQKLANKNFTGTENVTLQFIKNMPENLLNKFDQIVLYLKKPIDSKLKVNLPENIVKKIIPLPYFWSSIGLSWEMKWHSPDILFVPSHSLPLIRPSKTAVIIHDIGFIDFPDNYSKKQHSHLVQTTTSDIKNSSIIFVPSEFTKKTIINKFSADPNKIIVSHLGIDHNNFHSNFSQKNINSVFKKYDQRLSKKPYIFFLGRIDNRKNISNIIKSFDIIKNKYHFPHILVLAGKAGIGYANFINQIKDLNLQEDIVFTDYIPIKHLPIFYYQADLFLFPSLYEGFGLPILEAQACRTPVITSNTTAMPEISGPGALLVDPNQPEDIAQNIKKIIENPSLKQQLIEKGIANSKQYSWEKFCSIILTNLIKLGKKYV